MGAAQIAAVRDMPLQIVARFPGHQSAPPPPQLEQLEQEEQEEQLEQEEEDEELLSASLFCSAL